MSEKTETDLGRFEGFNFREDCAIETTLTADDVINWDHDANGEAEFWPDGSNVFVAKLLPGTSCTAEEISEVMRIFEELHGLRHDLAKAVYLRDRGSPLEDISRRAIGGSCLYVFGPGWFVDLEKEAAYKLFELFWPNVYAICEKNTVPGLTFDVEKFMSQLSTLEIPLAEGGYLVVDTQ